MSDRGTGMIGKDADPLLRRLIPRLELSDAFLPGAWGLQVAALNLAFRDLRASNRHDARSARAWLSSDDLRFLSFRSVCEYLGLEPASVRFQLRAEGLLSQPTQLIGGAPGTKRSLKL